MLTILRQRISKKILSRLEKKSTRKLDTFYFGYGANIDPEFFKNRIENFKFLGVAKLHGYEFLFNMPCEYKDKGFGGIQPKENAVVYGTLYILNKDSIALLDCLEWVPFKFYRREVLHVSHGKETVPAHVYIPCFPRLNLFPTPGYQNLLVQGASRVKLPNEYIEYLKSFQSKDVFELDHSFNLENPGATRIKLPKSILILHDVLREILCKYI
jgi:gamma-glutamylcyclotransferase (GGCT)/AIG2-like uncharacterized protein YtfP